MLLSRYYTLINLFVLSVVIYCGVDIFYTFAGSKFTEVKVERVTSEHIEKTTRPGKRPSFDHYTSAINRDLFGVVEDSLDKSGDLKMEDLEPTALNISLLGTVSGDRDSAVAVIQEKAKRTQALYKEGDTIQNATISKILRGKVILRVGDKNQILTMEEKSTSSTSRTRRTPVRARPVPGSTITLDRDMVAKSLGNIGDLLSQVRVRPHYKNGKADGLMLSQVKPNTIFTKLGLRNGDIIQSVDGEQIESPDEIMDFYEDLKSGSSVSLEIMRRGKKKSLTYRFK